MTCPDNGSSGTWKTIATAGLSIVAALIMLARTIVRRRRVGQVLPTFSPNTTCAIVKGANTPGDARTADPDASGVQCQQLWSKIEIYSGQGTLYAGEDRANEFLYRFYLPPDVVVESRRTSIPASDWLFLPSKASGNWQFEIKGVHYIYNGATLYLQYVIAKLTTKVP